MANITCPACGYEAQDNKEIMNHMKQMTDDQHKDAVKQTLGAKGGEVKDKVGDMASGIKDKISS